MTLKQKKKLRVLACVLALPLFMSAICAVEPVGRAAEHEPSLTSGAAPLAAGISLEAAVYDIEPSTVGAQKLADLAQDGQTVDIGAWDHTDTRFLTVSLAGVPADKQYELVIEMQPIIKAMSLPDVTGATRSFTVNTMPVNQNGTFTAENYSGTIVYTLNQGTEAVQFAVELGYDITLWSKRVGELNNDVNKPLLTVYLREKDSAVKENPLSFHKAQAPADWSESIYASVYSSAASVNLFHTETGVLHVSRMVNGSYTDGFYYPKLQFVIDIPQYTLNGTTYYLECISDSLKLHHTGGSAEYDLTVNDVTHSVTLTVYDYYIQRDNTQFSNLQFRMSDTVREALQSQKECTFSGKIRMIWFRSRDAETGESLEIKSGATFKYTYAMRKDSKMSNGMHNGTPAAGNENIVNLLGGYIMQNLGQGASESITLRYDFDTQNTNAIGVTTINIIPNFELRADGEYYYAQEQTVHYTMVDRKGNLVVENATIVLNNTNKGTWIRKSTNGKNDNKVVSPIRFYRNLLPVEHQDCYFKSVEYTINTVPDNFNLYSSSGQRGTSSGGTFWGYVFGTAGTVATNTVTLTNYVQSDVENASDPVKFVQPKTIKTTLSDVPSSSYYLNSGTINGEDSTTEITAGESFTIAGKLNVTNYPYSNTSYLKGMRIGLLLPQGITFSAGDVTAKTKGNTVAVKTVVAPTATNPLWVVYLDPDVAIGYYTENLVALSVGDSLDFSITLHTDSTMPEQTFPLRNILFAAADGQNNRASGTYNAYQTQDPADLNNYTAASGNDKVACFSPSLATAVTIKATPARLDIFSSLRQSEEDSGDQDAALKHFADHATYDFQIACSDGGTAKDFFYLIPIAKVQAKTEQEFIPMHHVNMVLRGDEFAPKITYTSGTKFKLLYTTDPFNGEKDYEYFAGDSIQWVEAQELGDDEWKKVTMIKVVTEEKNADIVTGTLSVISVPLFYGNDNYDYATDATTYAQDAGMTVQFKSRGSYVYQKGNQMFSGTLSSGQNNVRLEYTVPETQKITLTAAKDRSPVGDGKITASVTITQGFRLAQNYGIRFVNPTNVNLVQSKTDFKNSNSDFAVTAQLIRNDYQAQFLSTDASVEHPIPLGQVETESDGLTGATTFTFEIFNGDALSDTVTPRTIWVDIIGDNGVTIPVEITILREAAPVGEVESAKIDEKRYLPFIGKDTVVISQGSAFTAQFVSADLIPNNYSSRTIAFNCSPNVGTTILMVDCTNETAPQFYHYKVKDDTVKDGEFAIPLTEFRSLADGKAYVNPVGDNLIPKETFLFVVDFADNAAEKSTSITLTTGAAADLVEDIVVTQSYQVAENRTFTLETSKNQVAIGQDFTISFSDEAPGKISDNTYVSDNRYTSREMALVIKPVSGALPVDARLVVGEGAGTQVHCLNAQGQFVLPLGGLSIEGKKSDERTMQLLSETLSGEMELSVQLYVSATSNDSQPMQGEVVGSCGIKVAPEASPSFKITRMERLLTLQESMGLQVSYEAQNISDCQVFITVQKKEGSGYVTGFYMTSVNGQPVSLTSYDITETVKLSKEISLALQNMTSGTWRVEITVKRGNTTLLTVPYNFLVVSP